MTGTLFLLCALLDGIGLGALFYGGLWWTLRRSLSSASIALWLPASFVLRTAVALAGFWFVADGEWPRLLACLLGFFIARITVEWLTSGRAEVLRAFAGSNS